MTMIAGVPRQRRASGAAVPWLGRRVQQPDSNALAKAS